MAITSAGVGSGLDINGIVNSIMAVERTPLTALQTKETTFKAQISAFGAIKSAMDSFKTSATGLSVNSLNTQAAVSSTPTAVGVTASGTAKAGSYDIVVSQLARADKQIFPGVSSASTPLGAGNMSISVGGAAAITIPTTDNSLQGISQAINNANAGVTATIVNDGTTNHLVVTAQKSGAANGVTITSDGALADFDSSNPSAIKQSPLDANMTIDGINVVKPSNVVSDAIAGVTLTLSQVSPTPVKVTMTRDDIAIKASVTGFVKSLNALNSAVRSATDYNLTTKKGGVLNSDYGATSILSSIRKEISKPVTGVIGNTTLASIGVSFQRDGTVTVDDAKLSKAMADNPNVLMNVFSGTDGVATRLGKLADGILSDTGVIATRTYGINASIKTTVVQEAALTDRLAIKEANVRKQFNALDSKIAGIQAQSNYVTKQLASMYGSR